MKSSIGPNYRLLIVGNSIVFAALALAAMGFAGAARARDNVSISVGIGVLPGVQIGASNIYPVYNQPVYVRPAPVYYQRAPVYYTAPPVYVVQQPVYHQRQHGWKHGHYKKHNKHNKHDRDDDRHGGYQQRGYYSQGYAPVYYQR